MAFIRDRLAAANGDDAKLIEARKRNHEGLDRIRQARRRMMGKVAVGEEAPRVRSRDIPLIEEAETDEHDAVELNRRVEGIIDEYRIPGSDK